MLSLKPVDRGLQFSFCGGAVFPTLSLDPFAGLQVLIPGEEVLDFLDEVRVNIIEFLNVIKAWVGWNTQQFVVTTAVVGHGEHADRSEEHTSELQSRGQLVCRLLLE